MLINHQIRATVASELDAVAVVPLDDAAKNFAVVENDSDRRASLHLLYVVKILCVSLFRRGGFLARRSCLGSRLRPRREILLLHFCKVRTKQFPVHDEDSFERSEERRVGKEWRCLLSTVR